MRGSPLKHFVGGEKGWGVVGEGWVGQLQTGKGERVGGVEVRVVRVCER